MGRVMRALVVADVHDVKGFRRLVELIEEYKPEFVLGCGDWGSRKRMEGYSYEIYNLALEEIEDLFREIISRTRLYTVYGNHDELELIKYLKNVDGSPIWLRDFEVRDVAGMRVMGLNGLITLTGRGIYHVAESEFRRKMVEFLKSGAKVEVVVSHDAPKYFSDKIVNKNGNIYHAGHELLSEALTVLRPRLWLHGHIHSQQYERSFGQLVICVGSFLRDNYVVLSGEDVEIYQNGVLRERIKLFR